MCYMRYNIISNPAPQLLLFYIPFLPSQDLVFAAPAPALKCQESGGPWPGLLHSGPHPRSCRHK